MDDDWEAVADKEVVIHPKITNDVNKWQGEDDDEDVKDSWEDEEEKKDEEKPETQKIVPEKTKTNKPKSKLSEQECLAEEAEEKRLADLTPEEKMQEKMRLLKVQRESDLKSALDTFGVKSIGGGLDHYDPQSKEEFKEFGAAISWKLSQYKDSLHFPQLAEDLVRTICLNLSATDMKKVKISVESLFSEKLKLEKANTKKTGSKGKNKATLRTENDDIDGYQKYGNDYGDDYDDFM